MLEPTEYVKNVSTPSSKQGFKRRPTFGHHSRLTKPRGGTLWLAEELDQQLVEDMVGFS